jgi:hypothetical protein
MANTITTPNMKLIVPTLQDPGTDYATNISNDLVVVDGHDHDGVNGGVQINIAGQVIDGDLSLDGYNLSNVRSVEFNNQSSQLSGSQDVNCLYVNQNNLGFNNSDGYFVQLTNGNSIDILSVPLTNFDTRSVSSNFTILTTDTYNLININCAGGAVTGTLPICAAITPTAAGRLFIFKDSTGSASDTLTITIKVAVGSGNIITDNGGTSVEINTTGGFIALYTDGINSWNVWSANTWSNGSIASVNSGGVLQIDDSTLAIENHSGITMDSTSQLVVSGSTIECNGATVMTLNQTGSLTLNNTATQVFSTGTSLTANSGSSVTIDGAFAGVTTGGTFVHSGSLQVGSFYSTTSNDLNSSTITISGASISGSATYTGELTVTGSTHGLALTSSATQTLDNSCTYNNAGANIVGGDVAYITLVPHTASTYTCDSGSYLDNFIGLELVTGGYTWTINLPSSPAVGRTITIADVNGPDPAASTYIVNISAGSNVIGVPGYSAGGWNAPSIPNVFSFSAQNTGNPGAGGPGPNWTNAYGPLAVYGWTSIKFTWMAGGVLSPGRWVMNCSSWT